jgi:hypothetical protein
VFVCVHLHLNECVLLLYGLCHCFVLVGKRKCMCEGLCGCGIYNV